MFSGRHRTPLQGFMRGLEKSWVMAGKSVKETNFLLLVLLCLVHSVLMHLLFIQKINKIHYET